MTEAAPTTPAKPSKLDLPGCGTCAVEHFSSCSTGVLAQCVIAAFELTDRAVQKGEKLLDPHDPADIQYVYDVTAQTVKKKPGLGVSMPDKPDEIEKVKRGIPDAIRQGHIVHVASAILITTALSPTKVADLERVQKRFIGTIGEELPRVAVCDDIEIAAYRAQVPFGVVAANKIKNSAKSQPQQ